MFLGLKEIFFGPPKQKKKIFSRNLNSMIWPNIGGGSRNGSGHLGTIRPQYSIQQAQEAFRCDRLLLCQSFDLEGQSLLWLWFRSLKLWFIISVFSYKSSDIFQINANLNGHSWILGLSVFFHNGYWLTDLETEQIIEMLSHLKIINSALD